MKKMRNYLQTQKLIKFSTAFLFALLVIMVLLPTKVSAVEGNWDDLKGSHVSGPSTVTIQDGSTDILSVDSGTVIINGTATINSTLTVRISTGATVQWNANLTTGADISGDFIVFEGNGNLEINGAQIVGSASSDLVAIDSTISSVVINSSSFTNNYASSGNALYLGNGGTLNRVTAVSAKNSAIYLSGGSLTIEGSNNTLTGYYSGINSVSSGAIEIENATITTTINYNNGYAIICSSNLSLTNVSIDTESNAGINQSNASATVTLTDCNDIKAYTNTVYAAGNLIIEDCTIIEKNALSYAVQAGGDLTIRENDGTTLIQTIHTTAGSGGKAVDFQPASAKTFTLSGGTLTGNDSYPVYIAGSATANLSGGEITYTGSANFYSALYIGGSANVSVSGTDIDGGDGYGIYISSSSADLTISSGSISGITGLDVTNANEVSITGGTFDGTSGYGIKRTAGTVYIAPTATTDVIVKGYTYGINGTLDYTYAPFAYVSTDYTTNNRDTAAISYDYGYLLDVYKNWIFKFERPWFNVYIDGGTIVGGGSSGRYQFGDGPIYATPNIPEGGTFIEWELAEAEYYGFEETDPDTHTIEFGIDLSDLHFTVLMDLPEAPAQNNSNNASGDSRFRPKPPTPTTPPYVDPRGDTPYIEFFGTRHGTSYVMRDLSVTPLIRNNIVDDKTAMLAVRSAVKRARSLGIDEIVINLPEGTLMTETFTVYIARYSAKFGVGININYTEE
jgi:hypothetical protein